MIADGSNLTGFIVHAMNGDSMINYKHIMLLIGLGCFTLCTPTYAGIKIEDYSLNSLLNTNRGLKVPGNNKEDVGSLSQPAASSKLIPIKIKFRSIADTTLNPNSTLFLMNDFDIFQNVKPALIGRPLVYPNPFRQIDGTTLGYSLSKNMQINIQIYDMFGHKVFEGSYPPGTDGGIYGYNKLHIKMIDFMNYKLSSGVYFFYIINKGTILGKGKMAIIP